MDGIRRSKTSGGVTTDFITQNGLVVRQTNGTVTLDFVYDSQQRPYALIYKNGTAAAVKYYYLLNLQGDVVGLLSSSGAVVARYSYNAWGKLLSVTDDSGAAITSSSHIANRNPLRYRGYYYDVESGFYYLQSRYYDPGIGRFINADSFVSTAQGFTGYNMFAYCLNNPVNYKDSSGNVVVAATVVVASAVAEVLFEICISVLVVTAIIEIAHTVQQYAPAKKGKPAENKVETKSVSTPASPQPPNNNNKNKNKTKKDGTPKNNQAQNKQVKDICKKYNLTKKQQRLLHDEISHRNYDYHEIDEAARWIAKMGK